MLRRVAFLIALLLAQEARAGTVTVVNTGATTGNVSVASTLTLSFNATGADFIFLAASQWRSSDATPTATFNTSQNFTLHAQGTVSDGGGTRRVTVFRLVAPSQTTANIVVTWSGGVDEAVIGATAWTGVDQTTPLGTATVVTSSGGTANISGAATGAVGSFTHDAYSGSADSTLGSTTNKTSRWHDWAAANTTEAGGATAAGTGSSVTHTWSNIGQGGDPSVVRIVLIVVPINAAASSKGTMLQFGGQ